MNVQEVGRGIAYLRKRAGLTQKDLADRIGISDKAVSKWERGVNLPDTEYLGKLAILLDTDIASLLCGDVIHNDKHWGGLLVLPDNMYGIGAETMVYDKPLVYYLLSYFMLVGIKKICVACKSDEFAYLNRKFGDGSSLGICLKCCNNDASSIQKALDDMDCSNVMVVLGRNLLYGVDQTRFFQHAMINMDRFTILTLPRKTGAETQIVFDDDKHVVHLSDSKKVITQYEYHVIPIFFCPKSEISGSVCAKGIIDIPDLSAKGDMLYTEILDRGYVLLPLSTPDEITDAAMYVRLVQKACGMVIYCLEEIAWRRGMISTKKLEDLGRRAQDSAYGRYVLNLSNDHFFREKSKRVDAVPE